LIIKFQNGVTMNKKTLALAVAAGLGLTGMSAQAAYDLDTGTPGADNIIALETLSTGNVTPNAGGTANHPDVVDGAATDMEANAAIGVGISAGEDLFVRYDLDNAIFGAGSAPTLTSTGNVAIATAQGGSTSATFITFQVSANQNVLQGETLTFSLSELAVVDPGASVGLSVAVYETLTQAVAQGDALKTASSTSMDPFVSFASGLKLTSAAATSGNTADVEQDFEAFTNASYNTAMAGIGSAAIELNGTPVNAQDGTLAILDDMFNSATSSVVISGDFTGANSTVTADANELQLGIVGANCAGATGMATNNAGTASTGLFVAALNTNAELCYSAGGDTIPEGTYEVTVTFSEGLVADQSNPASALTGPIGAITHNGTTVELPYLTTFEDYNQRIVMVNRGGQDAEYSISDFQTESDTTAVAGTAATGTIPAGGSAVVKVSDVVTLTGKTRTAATVNIVAATGNISVATTQVNLADSSTDTIVLQ
jgi:hypothetical protein